MKSFYFKGRKFRGIEGATHPAYSYATFEADESPFREQYWDIEPGDVVFDIGASYGAYALTAAVMAATVYAFEPEPSVFNDLLNNIQINSFFFRCYAFNMGLYSEVKTMNMKDYAPHWSPQTITENYHMDTLDNFVNIKNIANIDWIKIDVEGAEENVIKGGIESIKKYKPNIIVECHTFLDKDILTRCKKLLEDTGHYTFEEVDRDPCVMLIAKPKQYGAA